MQFSRNYQGFIFGVLFRELKDNKVLIRIDEPSFTFRTSQLSVDSLRNLFKALDFTYPRKEDGTPKSYTQLSKEEMNTHLLWIYATVANSGYEFKH